MKMMKKKMKKFNVIIIQFIKFGIVGLSNTMISLLTYYILIFLGCHYLIANTAGFLLSVVNAFYWNNKYVFKERLEADSKKAFVKVFLSYGLSFGISTILIWILVNVLHISQWIAPILRLVVTVPLNFLLNKVWAFKDHTI